MQRYFVFLGVILAFLYAAGVFAWSAEHEVWRMVAAGCGLSSLLFLVLELGGRLHEEE